MSKFYLRFQITTLINHKNTRLKRTGHARKALQDVCTKLKEAILYFVKIGEEIASENPEFAADMSEACIEAKEAASMMSSLTDIPVTGEGDTTVSDRANIIRAARAVLAAVTRVLIITDMVVVQRLISAARKVGTILILYSCSFNIHQPQFRFTLHVKSSISETNTCFHESRVFPRADATLHFC